MSSSSVELPVDLPRQLRAIWNINRSLVGFDIDFFPEEIPKCIRGKKDERVKTFLETVINQTKDLVSVYNISLSAFHESRTLHMLFEVVGHIRAVAPMVPVFIDLDFQNIVTVGNAVRIYAKMVDGFVLNSTSCMSDGLKYHAWEDGLLSNCTSLLRVTSAVNHDLFRNSYGSSFTNLVRSKEEVSRIGLMLEPQDIETSRVIEAQNVRQNFAPKVPIFLHGLDPFDIDGITCAMQAHSPETPVIALFGPEVLSDLEAEGDEYPEEVRKRIQNLRDLVGKYAKK